MTPTDTSEKGLESIIVASLVEEDVHQGCPLATTTHLDNWKKDPLKFRN